MIAANIIAELVAERQAQDEQWGGPSHDDQHSLNEWIAIACRHLGLAASDGGEEAPARFRRQMIRIAALAVAAVKSVDRNSERVAGKYTPGSGY